MNSERLEHYRQLLITEGRKHLPHIRDDQMAALEFSDDGAKDTPDLSLMDVNKELLFRLGEQESRLVADIDQALLRIKEGSFGTCARCNQPIDERRLEAMPWVRYDASCQSQIETERTDRTPSL